MIENADDDLRSVPADTEVLDEVGGDLTARASARHTGHIGGDAAIEVSTAQCGLRMSAVISMFEVGSLTAAGQPGGDVELQGWRGEIEQVGGDFQAVDSQSVIMNDVGGDCSIGATEAVATATSAANRRSRQCQTVVAGGSVGGDVVIKAAASAQIGDAGGDCVIHSVTGDVSMGSVGGDCTINAVDGAVRLGNVGGDAHVRAQGADVQIGNIGGDLHLASAFPAGSSTRVTVGGDAVIELPPEPNLTLRNRRRCRR